jgi:type II secretory pathway pseudopilin PulG
MTTQYGQRQDGFTLIELVVAMAIAITVIIALAGIMIVTLRQTHGTLTRIDATRQARVALSQVENELHSACVGGAAVPIQAGSTASKLVFLSYSGDAVSPVPVWHELSLTGTTLTDTSYGATVSSGGSGWTRSGAGTSTQLLTNVAAPTVAAQGTTSVFQYFEYRPFLGTDGNYYWTVQDGTNPQPVTGAALSAYPLPTTGSGLSAADAANTVEVLITLSVGPTTSGLSGAALTAASVPMSDAISLRLTTPPDFTTSSSSIGDFGPCL